MAVQPATRIRRAGRVVALGAGLGLAGQLLFYDVALGINFPIAIAGLMAGGWLARRPGARMHSLDLWLAPAAVAFAAFAALRADTTIVTLDVLTALALSGTALASFGGRVVVARAFASVIGTGIAAGGWVAVGAVPAIAAARRQLPGDARSPGRPRPALPVLRGLLLAAPVAIVFVSLLSSADAVFARAVAEIVDIDLGDAPGRLALAAVLAWLAAGALALAASVAAPGARPGASVPGWRLGTIEAVTVLVVVDAVFVGFVALQAAYLFGGLDTMQAAGLSYAEYARRGFFELVAVSGLAIGLVITLVRVARVRGRLLVGAGAALTVLTGVVLGSAAFRLRLYQEAYGWTELRLYVLATIVLLGLVLAALAVSLVADRVRWIGHVTVVAGLAIGLGLNVIGPVRFITEQNVARVVDPALVPDHGSTGLDELYLATLGDDAVADLVRALPHLDRSRANYLRLDLSIRLRQLRGAPGLEAWQAWNLGRETARSALETASARGDLRDR